MDRGGSINDLFVRGNGVFKSTDGGITWNHLSSTSGYRYCSRIICDNSGNVYLGTVDSFGTGLVRSTDQGAIWTSITPTGIASNICDLKISSTGRLHVATGVFSSNPAGYRFTDNPSTVTSGTWTAATTPFTQFHQRTSLDVNDDVLYALPVTDTTPYSVSNIWKSIDGGVTWATTPTQPFNNGNTNGQAWFDLAVAINPSNPNECIAGTSFNYNTDTAALFKTIDGGSTWTNIPFNLPPQPHPDIQYISWWDSGNKLVILCDGGVFYSDNKGTDITDRNIGLRIRQYYSVAIHPTLSNYFLAGSQDNGTSQFTSPGLSTDIEVTGGDGGYTFIDQINPLYQFTTFLYNNYVRSSDGGVTWPDFFRFSDNLDNDKGQFINPWDYDNTTKNIYASTIPGNYLLWKDSINTIPSTTTNDNLSAEDIPFNITPTPTDSVISVHISPFTPNRIFFGTSEGRIFLVDNANDSSLANTTIINTGAGMSTSKINCIATGSDDMHLLACFSNYDIGSNHIWITTDGGINWTNINGDLGDVPVFWAQFYPTNNSFNNTSAYIATDNGVFGTALIDSSNTVWTQEINYPTVRTTMLQYRSSDNTMAAASFGRGLWTTIVPVPVICFAEGTNILTDSGFVPIEQLTKDSNIMVFDEDPLQPIPIKVNWISNFTAKHNDMNKYKTCPIKIMQSTFADNVPQKDLFVSPYHAILLNDVLVESQNLTNNLTIIHDYSRNETKYYHIKLDKHRIINAEGVLTESYFDVRKSFRKIFDNCEDLNDDPLEILLPHMSVSDIIAKHTVRPLRNLGSYDKNEYVSRS